MPQQPTTNSTPKPAPRKRPIQRLRRLGLTLALTLLAILLASPLWFPWALRAAGQPIGLDFHAAKRLGFWRLQVDQLSVKQPHFLLEVRRLTVLQPLGWLVDRLRPGTLAHPDSPHALAENWRLTTRQPPPPSSTTNSSTAKTLDLVAALATSLQTWLPNASLRNGEIRTATTTIAVPIVSWNQDQHLRATLLPQQRPEPLYLECKLPSARTLNASLRHHLGHLLLTFHQDDSGHWTALGALQAAKNNLTLQAHFSPNGWLPTTATANLDNLLWPTNLLVLPAFLAPPSGQFAANWSSNRLSLTASLASRLHLPGLPPQDLAAHLAADSDLNHIALRHASLTSALLQLTLTAPIELPVPPSTSSTPLIWALSGDLAALANPSLSGKVTGSLHLQPNPTGPPALSLNLNESRLTAWNQAVDLLDARLSLAWPRLDLERLLARNEDALFSAEAQIDLLRQEWTAAHWRLHSLPAALTSRLHAASAQFQGTLRGPLPAPSHTGQASLAQLRLPGSLPLNLDLAWQGQSSANTHFYARAATHADELAAEGTLSLHLAPSPSGVLHLTSLSWFRQELAVLQLLAPTRAEWNQRPATPHLPTSFHVSIPSLDLVGDRRHLHLAATLDGTNSGTLQLAVEGLHGDDLSTLLTHPPSWLTLDSLNVTAGWTNGPLNLQASAALTLQPSPNATLQTTAEIHASPTEIRFHAHDLRRDGEPVGTLSGRIPITLHPQEPASLVRFRPHDPLEVHLSVSPHAPFWRELASRWGLLLDDASIDLQLAGTSANPAAQLRFQASRLHPLHPPTTQSQIGWPSLDQPQLEIDLKPSGLLSAHAEVSLARQRGVLHATLPLNLDALLNRTAPLDRSLLQPLEAHLQLPHWDLAAISTLFPDILSPQGTLNLSAHLQPGLRPSATLVLTNAATRPLPPLGPLRQIHATLLADSSTLQLQHGHANLSGQPISLSGSWRFHPPTTNDQPRFHFALSGPNLALIRQPDLSLRGTVALELAGTTLSNATVSGIVHLHNSLLLRDLHSLVSGNIKTPTSRPPFFSIEKPPWGDWRLDVRVEGNRFLRVVTPVLQGRVSAGVQLAGTLREPVALGDVTVPEGRVRFPFGGLNLDHGRISLTREDPFVPQVAFQATGLNFGYDVTLNVSGPASDPNVLFSSIPPLSSTQILLMLSSGEVPNQAFEYSTRSRLQNLALFVGQDFLGKLTGNPDNDRLSIRSGERISDQGQLTYTIEYRLTPRWSIFGLQDRFDTYLGGLKWRVYSK